MEGGQSFIYAPRHRVALSFYPPTEPPRGGEASSGSPSAIGLLELSTSEVHAPQCHHVGGGLLHTPSHPYSSSVPPRERRERWAVIFFCTTQLSRTASR